MGFPLTTEREKALEVRKPQKGLVSAMILRLCVFINTLKLSKQHEGKQMR
jgi:hypothetical protein